MECWKKMSGVFEKDNTVDVLHVLIDATFVVSVLFTGFGLLIFSANEGTFDMLSYGMTSFISLFKNRKTSIPQVFKKAPLLKGAGTPLRTGA